VLDGLRLPVEDAAEAAAEILAEVLVELAGETELARTEPEARVEIRQLEARVEIQQLEELEVLLVAVRC
jgi:hypothetical protein